MNILNKAADALKLAAASYGENWLNAPPDSLLRRELINAIEEAKQLSGELSGKTMVSWVDVSEKPKPLIEGVKCDLFLAVNPWGGSPEILSYIYETDQWTRCGDDTQLVMCWMDIRHVRSALPNASGQE